MNDGDEVHANGSEERTEDRPVPSPESLEDGDEGSYYINANGELGAAD